MKDNSISCRQNGSALEKGNRNATITRKCSSIYNADDDDGDGKQQSVLVRILNINIMQKKSIC